MFYVNVNLSRCQHNYSETTFTKKHTMQNLKIFLITQINKGIPKSLIYSITCNTRSHNNNYNVVVMYSFYCFFISYLDNSRCHFRPYSLSKPILRKRYLSKSTLQTKHQVDRLYLKRKLKSNKRKLAGYLI
jgi:hypothetical protein